MKQDIKPMEKEAKEIEGNLKMFFADAETNTDLHGNTLATWKAPKPSNKFDDKTFISEHPDLAAPYIHQVQGARRLLLK